MENNYTDEAAYEVTKRKRRKWPAVLGICLAGAAAAIVIPLALINSRTVKLSDFVEISYDGISGYAKPESVINKDRLYDALAGDEKNEKKLESYKNFADSVAAAVTGEKVANGDSLEVNVTFDEELRKNTGYRVSDESFSITAEGIDPGKAVNLFEDAAINITGISPDATLAVENKSTDEYLGQLTFTAEKNTVANGDKVAIKCDVTDEELAKHGFTTTSLSAMYDVEGLSEYIGVEHITKEIADKITDEGKALIESETADNTYRMIYKLTNNAEYLSVPNTETAEDTALEELWLLKRKADAEKGTSPENMTVAIYSVKLKVQDKEERGYFAFTYPDSYVTADGITELNSDTLLDTLMLNTDLEALRKAAVSDKEAQYELIRIDTAGLEKEPEEISETTAAITDEALTDEKSNEP